MRIVYIICIGNTSKVWDDVPVKQGFRSELKDKIYSVCWQLIRAILFVWIVIKIGSLNPRVIFSQNLLVKACKDSNAH